MKLTFRNTHRDIAYFYVGLIISFSLSGILLNHRRAWNPTRYSYSIKEISIAPTTPDSVNDSFISSLTKAQSIDDNLRGFRLEGKALLVFFEQNEVFVDLISGKGKIETFKPIPLFSQMIKLHKDTSGWWVYFSDTFAIGMLILAVTGMLIEKGQYGFRKRGWKLALTGLVFPIIFLCLFS